MDRRLGGPLPHQPANPTRVHLIPPEFFTQKDAFPCAYAVLAVVSNCYPPVWGRLPTRYSPVRHSVTIQSPRRDQVKCFVRLACVKHAASVHPEPGSNSRWKMLTGFTGLSSFVPVSVNVDFYKPCFLLLFFIKVLNWQIMFSRFPWRASILFQGCFTVQLSMYLLSQQQLWYLITWARLCQQH